MGTDGTGPRQGPGGGGASEFEAALERLEEIVRALEGDELRLDEALALFERGVGHLRTASRLLEEARGTVEELIADASGGLRRTEFDPGSPEDRDASGAGAGEASDAG